MAYRSVIGAFRPVLLAGTRRDWAGAEHLPTDRGFIVVSNHTTLVDPATLTHFLWDNGFPPYFMAKEGVFRIPVLGRLLQDAEQIPVHRGGPGAAESLTGAVSAIDEGKVVVIFPEGTTTKDPERWPMVAKTGAARLALTTGCPVIPVAQWGTERIMPRGRKIPDLVHRHTVHLLAGEPVDLGGLHGGLDDPAVLHEATDRIMDRLTVLVERLRGEPAPPHRFDPNG
ncbi:MAG: lysophospholipid acyltransferase family protein [Candidatus Nanopelagicales bacterium]